MKWRYFNNNLLRLVARPLVALAVPAKGALSFARFAKGGNHERLHQGFAHAGELEVRCRPLGMTRSWYKRHCYPPLQKTRERGTPFRIGKETNERLGHPPSGKSTFLVTDNPVKVGLRIGS